MSLTNLLATTWGLVCAERKIVFFMSTDTIVMTAYRLRMHFTRCAACRSLYRDSGKPLRRVTVDVNQQVERTLQALVEAETPKQMLEVLLYFVQGDMRQAWACGDPKCAYVATEKGNAVTHMFTSGHRAPGRSRPTTRQRANQQVTLLADVFQVRGVRGNKLVSLCRLPAALIELVRALRQQRAELPWVQLPDPTPAQLALVREVREQDLVRCLLTTPFGPICVGKLTQFNIAKERMYIDGGGMQGHFSHTAHHRFTLGVGGWVDDAGRMAVQLNQQVMVLARGEDTVEARRQALGHLLQGPPTTLYACPFEDCTFVRPEKRLVVEHLCHSHFREPGQGRNGNRSTITYQRAGTLVITAPNCYQLRGLRPGIVRWFCLTRLHPVMEEMIPAYRKYAMITSPEQQQARGQQRQQSSGQFEQTIKEYKAEKRKQPDATPSFASASSSSAAPPPSKNRRSTISPYDVIKGSNKELRQIERQIEQLNKQTFALLKK